MSAASGQITAAKCAILIRHVEEVENIFWTGKTTPTIDDWMRVFERKQNNAIFFLIAAISGIIIVAIARLL